MNYQLRLLRLSTAAVLTVVAAATMFVSPALAREPERIVGGDAHGAYFLPQARELAAAAQCTGWKDQYAPPSTIRVYRTRGPAAGTVQTVPFRDYVGIVLTAEWPAFYPLETLKVGAQAVKQFAWYYTMVSRSSYVTAGGECYDVTDWTNDQVFQPETRTPAPRHLKAIDAIWPISLRKTDYKTGASRFFLTGYRSGEFVACGADADRWRLYQHSAFECGHDGLTFEQILRVYLDPRLEIIDLRRHDVLGADRRGDATVLTQGGAPGTTTWHALAAGGTSFAAPVSGQIPADLTGALGYASADVTGDGLDDLVSLRATGGTGKALDIVRATGTGYGTVETWSSWDDGRSTSSTRLLVGDFTGDGRPDAATWTVDEAGAATLDVHAAGPGAVFTTPAPWWSGTAAAAPLAGDFNGDGRTDLVIAEDRAEGGTRYSVVPSLTTGGGLGSPQTWLDQPAWTRAQAIQVVADDNRDGRDDLYVIQRAGTSISVTTLKATRLSTFASLARWTAPAGTALTFDGLKAGAVHVNFDGREDLVFYQAAGSGTRIVWLRSANKSMVLGTALMTPLNWSAIAPY